MRRGAFESDRAALIIVVWYAALSVAWITFSDVALTRFFRNPQIVRDISIGKGWAFVGVTATLLYVLIRSAMTRLRRSDEQMQLMFNSANDSIYVFRLKADQEPGNIVDANDAAVQRLGYTREEFRCMSPRDLVRPDLREAIKEAYRDLLADGRLVIETVQVAKDGHEIPVELNVRLVRLEKDYLAVTVARDITDRKRAEDERREALLAVERDKRRFYRETIQAVTGGKFELVETDDARAWMREPGFTAQLPDGAALSRARHDIMGFCRGVGMSEERVLDFELAVGEALANALKHAGEAAVEAGSRDQCVWVAVSDHGAGIDTFAIPKVALVPGFTTAASMGLGYTLILETCDKVRLATGTEGTTILMEKRLREVPEAGHNVFQYTAIG